MGGILENGGIPGGGGTLHGDSLGFLGQNGVWATLSRLGLGYPSDPLMATSALLSSSM